jgi:hypothetical protein
MGSVKYARTMHSASGQECKNVWSLSGAIFLQRFLFSVFSQFSVDYFSLPINGHLVEHCSASQVDAGFHHTGCPIKF